MSEPMSAPDFASLAVMVADDEPDIRLGLRRLLEILGITDVREAGGGLEALEDLRQRPADIVLTDLMMPGMTGAELLEAVKRRWPKTVVVLLTGFGTVQTAVQCLQGGAAHFLTKPFDNAEITGLLRRLGAQVLARRSAAGAPRRDVAIIAEDERTQAVFALVERVAPSNVPVLIEGESGSGKEVVAQAIHTRSAVSEKSFQAVNCAALSETLLESELFGHVKGAFTGADKSHAGLFAQAEGGTVFLDEVASMSAGFQGKLLRVLQEKVVRPVGGGGDVPVDFRLVAATNRDLEEKIAAGEFREDLFYRLAVVRIPIPPLRQRPADILPLALSFAASIAEVWGQAGELEAERAVPEISDAALRALQEHPWPGNVRELENVIQRAMIVCCGPRILPFHLGIGVGEEQASELEAAGVSAGAPGPDLSDTSYTDAKRDALERFQREFVQRALENSAGNVSRAAATCGMTRAALQKIMRQLKIDRTDFEQA